MPEATFTIEQVFTKEGAKNGKPWKRFDIKPVEHPDDRYKTFSASIGSKAVEWTGAKVTAEYTENEYGRDITELRLEGAPPEPGAKPYEKAAENPKTQRSIAAAVALKEAVATVSHTIKVDDDLETIGKKVGPLTRKYFNLLNELSGAPPEVPFE